MIIFEDVFGSQDPIAAVRLFLNVASQTGRPLGSHFQRRERPIHCASGDLDLQTHAFLQEGECTVVGAAILGGVGSGVFKTVEEGCKQMLHKVRTFEPDPKTHETYNELYALWQESYKDLADAGFYKDLNKFQLKYA